MSTAEVADLAVRLTLDGKQFQQALGRIDRRLGAFSGAVNRNLGRAFDTALAAGARALVGAFKGGIASLSELETLTAQTNAVIKSTGGIAGVTADQVRSLAEEFEGVSAVIDDKVIQSAENVLLRFTNIREDAFKPALTAVLDFATATGRDATDAARALGRALNDPTKGLGLLGRAGVSLDKKTEARIKKLAEEGKLYEAQTLLLDELTKRYGGSFAATADTAAGKQAKLQDAIEGVQMAFADKLLPIVSKVATRLTDYLAKPETIEFFRKLGDTIGALFTDQNLDTIASALQTAGDAVGSAISAFNSLPPEVKALAIGALTLNKVTGGAVGGAVEGFAKLLGAGLKQIFAANVTVIGGNVMGGGVPGVGGVPTGGGGIKGALGTLGVAAGGTLGVAAVGVVVLAALYEQGKADLAAGRKQFQYYLTQSGQLAYGPGGGMSSVVQNTQATADNTAASLDAFRAGERASEAGLDTIAQQQRDQLVGFRQSEKSLAAVVAGQAAKLLATESKVGSALSGRIDTSNARLSRIAAKKTSFSLRNALTVVSNTAVSVRDTARTTSTYKSFVKTNGLEIR